MLKSLPIPRTVGCVHYRKGLPLTVHQAACYELEIPYYILSSSLQSTEVTVIFILQVRKWQTIVFMWTAQTHTTAQKNHS